MAINERKSSRLRFGIYELDYLLNKDNRCVFAESVTAMNSQEDLPPEPKEVHSTAPDTKPALGCLEIEAVNSGCMSLCILGPDGTGKSLLALHLANHYLVDAKTIGNCQPLALYFSTDLSQSQAETSWKAFALDNPQLRWEELPSFAKGSDGEKPTLNNIGFRGVKPFLEHDGSHNSLLSSLCVGNLPSDPIELFFLDSQAKPCGDDWLYLSRFISTLPLPSGDSWPHLLLIDAVEGLEPAFGRRDIFGHESAGRTRLAQLIRAAREKCHIVYVVEEPRPGETLDTQYVTDVVIRLTVEKTGNYSHRTIEVEKARGAQHIRGQHDFAIRSGVGSATGEQVNADDPKVPRLKNTHRENIAYMHVMRSLHSMSRQVLELPSGETPDINPRRDKVYGFGIKYLDSLLPRVESSQGDERTNGLIGGTASALIGPLTTHKSRLARAFLAQVLPDGLDDYLESLESGKQPSLKPTIKELGVLISTQRVDRSVLFRTAWQHRFGKPFAAKDTAQAVRHTTKLIEDNLCPFIVRRLEVHRYSSQGIVHVIKESIQSAQQQLLNLSDPSGNLYKVEVKEKHGTTKTREICRNIRFVFDDWHVFQDTFPEAAQDPMLLPHIFHFLSRQGITALFLDTEPGIPLMPDAHSDVTLRALASRHLYTWLVPFYGERRIAITTTPPAASGVPSPIFELRPRRVEQSTQFEDEQLIVDPHFEMYTGLESSDIKRVALKVILYNGAKKKSDEEPIEGEYITTIRQLMSDLFGNEDHSTLETVDSAGYDRMRDYVYLQDGTRLDHTLVMQVDEFWSESIPSLADLTDYMNDETDINEKELSDIEDPSRLRRGQRSRLEVFNVVTKKFKNDYNLYFNKEKKPLRIDKVPFLWDFGFLLANREQWLSIAKSQPNSSEIWSALSVFELNSGEYHKKLGSEKDRYISWYQFFGICELARSRGYIPFDIDLQTSEVLSCLVLEVWCSILLDLRIKLPDQILNGIRHDEATMSTGLVELIDLKDEKGVKCGELALALALQLIFSNLPKMEIEGGSFVCRPANPNAFTARHYYSTAARKNYNSGRLVPLKLPGWFSVRGDWFLGLAKGSRSPRLGLRAMDLLCSTRGNFERLRAGIGLPVREILSDDSVGSVRTALVAPWKSDLTPNMDIGHITLEALYAIAPDSNPSEPNKPQFNFLWRSLLQHYDQTSRRFHRWLGRMYLMHDAWRIHFKALEDSCWKDLGSLQDGISNAIKDIEEQERNKKTEDKFSTQIELLRSMLKQGID